MIVKKKIFKTVFTCILICCLCFSGCGADTPDPDTEVSGSEAVGSGAEPTPSPQPSSPEEYYHAPMPGQVIPKGREIVTLGIFNTVYATSPMRKAVDAFNQAQEKYFVWIEIYYDYERFLLDIARKQAG